MTERQGPNEPAEVVSREELAWAAANMPLLRSWAAGPYFLREALLLGFVLGLAAHVGGYLLRHAVTGEPLGLFADLLATLGTTLWTGVVLAIFVQVLPDARRRYLRRRLDLYEAALADEGESGGGDRPRDGGGARPS